MRILIRGWNTLRQTVRQGIKTLRATYARINQADLPLVAGSLSYMTVLTLVPLLAVSLSVFHWLGGLDEMMKQIEPFLIKNLIESSGAEVSRYLSRAIRRVHSGAIGVGGVVGLFFASTKLFHDMERAVQRVWITTKRRALWKSLLVYWLVMFAGPLLVAALLGVIGRQTIGRGPLVPLEVVAASLAFLALFSIYKWVPSRKVEFRPAFAAALLATAALALTQEFYSSVMRGLFRFSKLYGSLAGLPLFLIWVLLLWWIVLLGAALTAILQERRDMTAERIAEQKHEKDRRFRGTRKFDKPTPAE